MSSPTLARLVEGLRCLPSVGQKSADRMAMHLLQHDRAGAKALSDALLNALAHVGHCQMCHTFSDTPICSTCDDPSRDPHQLCVVESPADQAALERTGAYKGKYFVLLGKINPLDGIGPQDIGVQQLMTRLGSADNTITELIVATNFTAEGELTAHVLQQAVQPLGIAVTRLARGVPIGSELEYVDLGTIAHALHDRR